ncbi:Fasciclin domain-containing protein [Cnuella takakiae]|uniref:Fasciclin domain-containing protein n=1 Tax=Cnuella takakiae TaxID=1302690 RepID=A0A1M4UQP5_9BACT|nr:fasciclin domain-containing protein [Cnuella takakiae]SHE59061.1 Fasciclin domain-containing protein [Cnuella takakiae]
MRTLLSKTLWAWVAALAMVAYSSCQKVEIVESTTTDVNMYDFLLKNGKTYSEWAKVLDRTGNAGFLNAYGAYTMFAPTNDAVKGYLAQVGKPTVNDVDLDQLKNLVRFHLIQDTIGTSNFKDGKLPTITMLGQYLITGVLNKDGVSRYEVNRQALVMQPNVICGNGIVHGLNQVLIPASKTLAQLIEADPDYSVFTQALKATGFYDRLNVVDADTSKRFMSVIAETNKALQDSGIVSYDALRRKYSQTGNPAATNDGLYLYVAYHIMPDARYLADIITAPSHPTRAPLEVLTSKLDGQTVLINEIEFNGNLEKGVALNRIKSDISATNGVLHSATAHFSIKVRTPVATYWDVADFPEIRKLPSFFRKQTYNFELGSLKDFTWEKGALTYTYTTASNFPVYWNDYLQIPLGLTNTARNRWVEMKTPLLVKGRYKVWVCYRQQKASNNNPPFPTQVSFRGEPMSRLLNFDEGAPSGTDGELEALGWKRYMEVSNGLYCGRLLGTIDVPTTDRHTIRMEAITGAGQNQNNLDMIHFIPVNMPQIRPLFKRDGGLIP